jgi:Type II CAAX prenyl endopeptidase Rce1-like
MGYFSAVRHPWPCLVLLVPLLAAYEAGVVLLAGDGLSLRNGADIWLRDAIRHFGYREVMLAPGLIIAFLVVLTAWRWSERPQGVVGVVVGMAIESIVFAGVLWLIAQNFKQILDAAGLVTQIPGPTFPRERLAKLIAFIGAGVYEEVLFRLILFAGLVRLLSIVLMPGFISVPLAMVASAILFSMAHHIGPSGEPLVRDVFLFRVAAGIVFAAIYWWRGFGIAVGTHIAYDILVGIGPNSPS